MNERNLYQYRYSVHGKQYLPIPTQHTYSAGEQPPLTQEKILVAPLPSSTISYRWVLYGGG